MFFHGFRRFCQSNHIYVASNLFLIHEDFFSTFTAKKNYILIFFFFFFYKDIFRSYSLFVFGCCAPFRFIYTDSYITACSLFWSIITHKLGSLYFFAENYAFAPHINPPLVCGVFEPLKLFTLIISKTKGEFFIIILVASELSRSNNYKDWF